MNPNPVPSHLLTRLIDLQRRARHVDRVAELRFLLVNDSHQLAAYRQGALWLSGRGVQALSGVVQVEANAPYVQWLDEMMGHASALLPSHGPLDPTFLPEPIQKAWSTWLPLHAYWLPLATGLEKTKGGLLLARELPWTHQEGLLLSEWVDSWSHAWRAVNHPPKWHWRGWMQHRQRAAPRQWAILVGGLLLMCLLPVRLTVLAPGELVPTNPDIIRSPLDGIIATFHVQPNDPVRQGQPLLGFDEANLRSQLAVAEQQLTTAMAEYRQTAQQTLSDPRAKAQLAPLSGRIEEKRAEVAFLREQLVRARVVAPRDGIVLLDDPTEWIGRPVSVGERILRVAQAGDVEVEAWVSVADAIPLEPATAVTLHLNTSPLSPVQASIRYLSHEAVERPDGTYAYRLRATLTEPTEHRVGLKGTVRISGRWVPVIYWILRRPWAVVRAYVG